MKGTIHMKVYTKKGDRGNTSLANGMSVSKSDDRIELVGTIDELNSYVVVFPFVPVIASTSPFPRT